MPGDELKQNINTITRAVRVRNPRGFPQLIVDAVAADPYSPGESDITATQLVDPPQIRVLKKKHGHEIVVDVEDRIWALVGQIGHAIIERAAKPGSIVERRLYGDVLGWKVGGQLDHVSVKTIVDCKFTSVWTTREGPKIEWVNQQNVYRWLAEQNGIEVNALKIIAIYRDWSKLRAKVESDYPQRQAEMINIQTWSLESAGRYIESRVRAHQAAEQGDVLPCTRKERWAAPDKWAVKKKSAMRALRLFTNEEEAEALAARKNTEIRKLNKGQPPTDNEEYSVGFRPGFAVRCEDYCSVSKFCPQFRQERAGFTKIGYQQKERKAS